MLWDIFCKVIDNYGDVGVCWRLAQNMASRGHHVRLWLDDPSPLDWMAPQASTTQPTITILPWPASGDSSDTPDMSWPAPGDVVIEAFGCELPQAFVAGMARAPTPPVWVNLEYLTAEPYAAKCHRLTSPVMHGPGKGLTKHFFYPGFTTGTGGLLRETGLASAHQRFDAPSWRAQHCSAPPTSADADSACKWISLFCYEPPLLQSLFEQLMAQPMPCTLLVTAGRASAAVKRLLQQNDILRTSLLKSLLSISYLPQLSQTEFDGLLWACDLNFVRGEDSLIRALWAGTPLVWQIYPQDDNAHHDKLAAFLDTIQASPALRQWHLAWNGVADLPLPALESLWADTTIREASQRLWQQDDLGQQLEDFVRTSTQPDGHIGTKKS